MNSMTARPMNRSQPKTPRPNLSPPAPAPPPPPAPLPEPPGREFFRLLRSGRCWSDIVVTSLLRGEPGARARLIGTSYGAGVGHFYSRGGPREQSLLAAAEGRAGARARHVRRGPSG